MKKRYLTQIVIAVGFLGIMVSYQNCGKPGGDTSGSVLGGVSGALFISDSCHEIATGTESYENFFTLNESTKEAVAGERIYDNNNCAGNPVAQEYEQDSYTKSAASTADTFNYQMHIRKRFMKALTQEGANSMNSAATCGISNWAPSQERDVSGVLCTLSGNYVSVDTTYTMTVKEVNSNTWQTGGETFRRQ